MSSLSDKNPPRELPVVRVYIASLAGGGSERVCTELCNGFASRGLDVELLLVSAFGPFLTRLDPAVRIVDFKASRGLKALRRVSRHLQSSPTIPVLVFGFNLGVALLLARRMGWHKTPVIYREGSSPKWYLKPSQRWGYRWAISKADKVITQNRSVREELESLGIDSGIIAVIPNPCAIPSATLTDSRQRKPAETPLILGVGRLSPEKGFDRLIRAFKGLHVQNPNAQLVICGEGAERTRLEQLVNKLSLQQAVNLPGFAGDLNLWYQQATLFVLSSDYEGQPNALIEAILNECPVLCAAGRGGTTELMQAAGLEDCVVPEHEFEQQFAGFARRVLAVDPSRRRAARERVARMTDLETILRQYLAACGVNSAFLSPAAIPGGR